MNELEMTFKCCKKALSKVDGGVKAKDGSKMTYAEAMSKLEVMEVYFRMLGSFSKGICKNCTHFDQRGIQSVANSLGRCNAKKTDIHVYNTCDRWDEK